MFSPSIRGALCAAVAVAALSAPAFAQSAQASFEAQYQALAAEEKQRAGDPAHDDAPIDGLYVAGNSMARMETGAVMQSGMSNARGMTYGWLIGKHAAGQPSDLLASEARRMGI